MKKTLIQSIGVMAVAAVVAGCAHCGSQKESNKIAKDDFGTLPDGTKVDVYTLRNAKGMEARISNYGGVVVSLTAPDKNGKYEDVVWGCTNVNDYLKPVPYFGALIGRYGNRIANAQFSLNGQTYNLPKNDSANSLHGGRKGFDKVVWTARPFQSGIGPALELTYNSKDGEEGYPGNLKVTALYTLTDNNTLRLDYTATTDKDTIVNLTQHSYFNLAGKGDILGHLVQIKSDKFTPVNRSLIPTGELRPVAGTPFDFNTPTAIGARINNSDEQLTFGKGYDHNWVINKKDGELAVMARVTEPTSGRVLEVLSTEPGMQFYSGNFLDGTITGKNGEKYAHRSAFCMEPQHYPDSPNQPSFPSTVLKPGQVYKNTIIYGFSAQK